MTYFLHIGHFERFFSTLKKLVTRPIHPFNNMFLSSLLRTLPKIGARYLSVARTNTPNIAFLTKFPTKLNIPYVNTLQMNRTHTVDKVGGSILEELPENMFAEEADPTMYMDSVLRKRRLKMKKHKLRKRRREQRSLKKRLGKI